MITVYPVRIPRYDEPGHVRQAFLDHQYPALGLDVVPVGHTAFWPPGHLERRWIDWLGHAVAHLASSLGQPVVLAEVPHDLYVDITGSRTHASLSSAFKIASQLFEQAGSTDARLFAAIRRELDAQAPIWIAQQLETLGMIAKGHFELSSGLRTDIQVRYGSFDRIKGGDGLRTYMTAVMARHLAGPRPGSLVFWAADRHRTLRQMMQEVRDNLRILGVEVELIALTGSHDDPRLDPADLPRVDHSRPVAVGTDIVGSGTTLRRVLDVLRQQDIVPDKLAPFITFSFSMAMTSYALPVVPSAVIEARSWSAAECRLPGIPERSDSESRAVELQDPEGYQAPIGAFWDAVLAGGRIGLSDDEPDPNHLHHTYITPGTEPDHLDAVLDDVFIELDKIGFGGIIFHDTPASAAVVGRIKTRFHGRHLPAHSVRRTDGRWDIPGTLDRAFEQGAVIVDDGMNRGTTLMQLIFGIRSRGYSPVAAVVIEDKLPPESRYVVESVCARVDERGKRCRLFSLHRSPFMLGGSLDGVCACEVRAIAGSLAHVRGSRPAYARRATDDLATYQLAPADERLSTAGMLRVDRSYPVSVQLQRLLKQREMLTSHTRVMDLMARDALHRIKAEDLEVELAGLEEAWLERVLLWLDNREAPPIRESYARSSSCLLSVALATVRQSVSITEFSKVFDATVSILNADPGLAEARYRDVLEHLFIAFARRPEPSRAIAMAVASLEAATSPAMQALKHDLEHVAEYLPFRPKPNATRYAFIAPDGPHVPNPDGALIREHAKRGWKLDLTEAPPRLEGDSGRVVHQLPFWDAIIYAGAIVKGCLYTSEMSKLFAETRPPMDRTEGKRQFEKICRHAERISLPKIVTTDMRPRKNGGSQDEHYIESLHTPGIVLWSDDRSMIWRWLGTPRIV